MDEAREPLPELAFRGLTEDDHAVIKQLHEDWFPVRYSAGFYDAAVRGRMVGTGSSTMELIMGSLSGLAFGLSLIHI